MPKITILPHATLCPEGKIIDNATSGQTICDLLLKHHIDIEHACEMSCACTTCHVIVRQGFDSLEEPTELEEDLLDQAWGLEADSFKDATDIKAQRSAALKDMDDKLQESRRIMLEDKKKVFMRDVSDIEAGEPTAEERDAFAHNDVYDDDEFIVEAEENGNEFG